jgi:hypothetical protein
MDLPGALVRPSNAPCQQLGFRHVDQVYNFTVMPPDPAEVERRARAVRRVLDIARHTPNSVIGLAPEGRVIDTGALGQPPPGVADFCCAGDRNAGAAHFRRSQRSLGVTLGQTTPADPVRYTFRLCLPGDLGLGRRAVLAGAGLCRLAALLQPAHGPLQGLMPDKVPPEQLGIGSGIKNLIDMLGLVLSSLFWGRLLDAAAGRGSHRYPDRVREKPVLRHRKSVASPEQIPKPTSTIPAQSSLPIAASRPTPG